MSTTLGFSADVNVCPIEMKSRVAKSRPNERMGILII
jgi:hypothetical protein